MEWFPLTLNERPKIEEALSRTSSIQQSPLAMLAFAPHMVWDKQFSYFYACIGEWLVVFAEYADGLYMPLPPLGPLFQTQGYDQGGSFKAMLNTAFKFMEERNHGSAVTRIENIPEELKPEFEILGYRIKEKDPDYLYHTQDLIALKGDRYKSQRAAYNQVVRAHAPRFQQYSVADHDACLDLFELWAKRKRQPVPGETHDGRWLSHVMLEDAQHVHENVLTHHEGLGLLGWVVKVGDAVCGYTFGFQRNPHVFCVLVEVTDRTIIGLSQYVFRELCRECSTYEFMNTMDDSGLASLAKSKRSYHPCRLVPNYIATKDA